VFFPGYEKMRSQEIQVRINETVKVPFNLREEDKKKAPFEMGLIADVTVTATLDRGVFDAGSELWPEAWFRATLADAYCGFLTFYAWVFYRERSWGPRGLWFVAIMALGNIAVSVYVLIRLFRLPAGAGPEQLLLRPPA